MNNDPLMQRELDRAIILIVNKTTFKETAGRSFSVALATFTDQVLRGRTYEDGQEVSVDQRCDNYSESVCVSVGRLTLLFGWRRP